MATPEPTDPGDGGGIIGGGGTPAPPGNIPPPGTPTPPPPPPSIPPAPPAPNVVGSSVSYNQPVRIVQIDLIATPSQRAAVQLGDQSCTIDVYQRSHGLFLDLYVSDVPIVRGALCLDSNLLVRDAYLGFVGDLMAMDIQGVSDPDYTGLGSRFVLVWIAPA